MGSQSGLSTLPPDSQADVDIHMMASLNVIAKNALRRFSRQVIDEIGNLTFSFHQDPTEWT